jgi:uncharacterized protein
LAAVELGPLDLLVVQPTPFCNLDCSYCYLPDRLDKRRMSAATLERLFARVFASSIVRERFTVVWHAGEPMVLPPSWYEQAFALAARLDRRGVEVAHSFQTNGSLIDDEWCALIRRWAVRIGVSVDGPAFLHDRHRKTRSGAGTHARVMHGIDTLRRNDVPFHVITVLTADALDHPDELYEFYVANELLQVGFNIEEIEGPNRTSSLAAASAEDRYRRFLARFFDLVEAGGHRVHVRELDAMTGALLEPPRGAVRTQETAPFAIVSVDCEGNFTSFSPELLGQRDPHYGDFVLGNVARDTFEAAAASAAFLRLHGAIAAGVARCRAECDYFAFCGGGAPVNKLCENGSFDSTETLFCRLNRKALADVVLARLERDPTSPAAGVAAWCGERALGTRPPSPGRRDI